MVVLMLHASRQQAFAFEYVRRPFGVAVTDNRALDAFDLAGDAREGEASLGVDFWFASQHGDRGVSQQHRHDVRWIAGLAIEHRLVVLVFDVHDE